jgi:predicted anti-sigma-YlaC factor YlaD
MGESPDHMTCQEVVELVTDYLEGALPPDGVELLEQHLNFCEGCRWHLDQVRRTIAAVGLVHEDQVSTETRERLLSTFREWKPQ